jgi:UDP-3-O-[3-hydroxymyristoyl] glucosamine N-acyltransferase
MAYYGGLLVRKKLYMPLVWISAKWWGVDIGKGCIFNGLTRFMRHPKSAISIGSYCLFNSGEASTLGGVSRSCRLSTLKEGAIIKIGENCGFTGTVIGCAKKIVLGKNIRCATNTLIFDTDWHFDDARTGSDAPVLIEDNVWLGINVTVFKGVTVGKNTLVGANSLVSKSLPPNVIAAGSPARVIRELKPAE